MLFGTVFNNCSNQFTNMLFVQTHAQFKNFKTCIPHQHSTYSNHSNIFDSNNKTSSQRKMGILTAQRIKNSNPEKSETSEYYYKICAQVLQKIITKM